MHHVRTCIASLWVFVFSLPLFANEVATPQSLGGTATTKAAAIGHGPGVSDAGPCTVSPLSPPDETDERYVVDCAPYFDAYLRNDAGASPEANLKIRRVVGDVTKLLRYGLISGTATIKIAAFDVNTGDFARFPRGAAQEHDKVFFNGHELGILEGAGGQWRLNTFTVPIDWVNFPTDARQPADNVLRVQIDADNRTPVWGAEIDWVSIEFRAVRPVVLAHGALSSGDTWRPFWVGKLDERGVPHAEIDFRLFGIRSIEENGHQLHEFIDDHRRQWGADKVNLEGHSMGGLASRQAVENHDGVDRVITIGSPHCGTNLATLGEAAVWLLGPLVGALANAIAPALFEATPAHMHLYNQFHGFNSDVRYTSLAGVYHAHTLSWRKGLQHIVGLGDLVVAQSSAQCLGRPVFNTKYESYGNNHNAIHINQTHAEPAWDITWGQAGTVQSVEPRLQAEALAPAVTADEDPEDQPFLLTAVTPGRVQQGETQSFQIIIDDEKAASIAILYSGGTLGAELVSPRGTHYTWDQVWDETTGIAHDDEEFPTTDARIKSYAFAAPEVGVWTINITGQNPGVTEFGTFGALQLPATTMTASVDPGAVHVGTPLRVSATVQRNGTGVAGATATALVVAPDDSRQNVVLHDDGANGDANGNDGIYTADIPTSMAGTYKFVVTAEDHRPGAVVFSRQTVVEGAASATLTRFTGPYSDNAFDTDGNRGLDVLMIHGYVNVVEPGTYRLFGTLTDLAGNPVTTAGAEITGTYAGMTFFSLSFRGSGIYASGINGPYKLSLRLAEQRGGTLLPAQAEDGVYTTGPYFYTSFTTPPPPDKYKTITTVESTSGPYQGPTTLVAHLKDADGQPLAGRAISFTVGFSTAGFAITDATGTATLTDVFLGSLQFLGGYRLDAFFGGDAKYASSTGTGNFFMGQGTQTITWDPPTSVPRNTILGSDNVLTATVQGSGMADPSALVYDPAEGTMLATDGPVTVTVTAPANDYYAEATKSVTIYVGTPPAPLTWNNPADIAYGTPLSAVQLNATSSTAGSFTYNPAAGTVLDAGMQQSLTVTFTPSNGGAASTKTVFINVIKGTQTIAWNPPAPIVYGTPLSAAQLNATVTGSGPSATGAVTYAPAAGTLLSAGAQTLTATAAATANYNPASASVTLQVQKATPSVTWSAPADIVYGTALSASQLNATASVPGTFTYTPAAGAVLNAGTQTLSATFTPADGANYASVTTTTSLTVRKAPVTASWTKPAAIVYGTPLSATQLNATANVPGTFSYTPAAGTVLGAGTQTLSASFTPADAANYETATVSTTIEVQKAPVTVTWSAPAAIVYGTPLSATQLNAAASAPGTFVYTPAAGTILNAGNGQTLSVAFTPTDTANYLTASATTTIDVLKAPVTVTWNAPAPIVYGTALSAMQLNATASVPGTFVYSPAAGAILDAGNGQTLSVAFTPTDTANYLGATATARIDVAKGEQTIHWSNPAGIVYGTPLSAAQLNATATVSGPAPAGALTYAPAAGTILNAGPQQALTVTAAATANYNAATATVFIDVAKAKPVLGWSRPAGIVYGTPLTGAQLAATANVAGTFVYTPAAGTILHAGAAQTLRAAFTPADTNNYENGEVTTTLDVAKAPQTISWAKPAGIVYGTALSAAQLNATVSVVGPAPAGELSYLPAAGTILDAGSGQTLTVRATATDDYEPATATTTLDVAKAKQTITWANPAAIVYGTALSAAQLNAKVSVVGPAAAGTLVYVPAAGTVLDAGDGQTLTVTAVETANYEPATARVTLDVRRAPLSLRADDRVKQYGEAVPTLTGTLTGVVNGDPIAAAYATTATNGSPAGTYPITASLVDPAGRLRNYDVTITNATLTVTKAPLAIRANDATSQYSDALVPLTATFTGFVLGETPAVLGGSLGITTTATKSSAPGTYPIAIGGATSPNYAITFIGGTYTTTQEDARAAFTAPLAVTAATMGATSANVTLSTTLFDISATADANGDTEAGDIRKATLTFVDRATGSVLCTAPLELIAGGDARIAAGTCSFTANLGSYTVGTRVAGWYTRDAGADDVTLTVAAPTGDFVTGGGALTTVRSAGAKAADGGSRQQFDLNLKYDNNGPVKGGFRLKFDRTEADGKVHQFTIATDGTGASISTVRGVDGGVAYVTGPATLTDITDARKPVVVAANAPMIVTVTDASPAKTQPTLAVTLANRAGGLWFASSWDGTRAAGQPLASGTLQIHWAK